VSKNATRGRPVFINTRQGSQVTMPMDITTVPCGSATRDRLAEYRDEHDHSSYDRALCELLGMEVEPET
jgi:hypothetical protein